MDTHCPPSRPPRTLWAVAGDAILPGAAALCGALLLLTAPASSAHAQVPALDHDPPAHGPAGDPAAADPEHHAPTMNEVMLFVGDTRKGGENEATVGFDYLRTLGGHWGVGVFLDYARGEFEREYIAGVGLFWAPLPAAPDLHLFGGLGYERLDADHGGHGEWEGEDLLLGRLGGTWLVHLGDRGQWLLAPQAFWDVVRGNDAAVLGVGFGYLF